MTQSVIPRQMAGAEAVQEAPGRMEPILDFFGRTVGWLEGDVAFSNDGYPIAFLSGEIVFAAKSGGWLGQFEEGVFRDRQGCVVAFLQTAWWCTMREPLQDSPLPPRVQSRLVPGRILHPIAPPHPAHPLLQLSSLDWERFVTGCAALRPYKTRL